MSEFYRPRKKNTKRGKDYLIKIFSSKKIDITRGNGEKTMGKENHCQSKPKQECVCHNIEKQ